MSADENRLMGSMTDSWLEAMPVDDLCPAAAARIETACLARLRRRRLPPLERQGPLVAVLGWALALLLGCGYLLEAVAQALAVYGVRLN
jgi:hypothetical protein